MKKQLPMVILVEIQNLMAPFHIGYELDGRYIPVFNAHASEYLVEYGDIVTVKWTILKKI